MKQKKFTSLLFCIATISFGSINVINTPFQDEGPILSLPANTLLKGETLSWSFGASDFLIEGSAPAQENPGTILIFWDGWFRNITSSTQVKISFFEDSDDDSPFKETVVTFLENDTGMKVGTCFLSSPHWSDLDGRIEFESLMNNTQITTSSIHTVKDGFSYTAAIPEPSSVMLMLIGSGALLLRRKGFLLRVHSNAISSEQQQ